MAHLICDDNENNLLNAVIKELNLDSYELSEEEGSKKGDNYVGVLKRICINGTKEDDKDFKLNLIFKQAPSDESRRIGFSVETCFLREIYMYETVLPVFSKLEEDFNIKEKLRYPTLFGTSRVKGSETVILEDLRVGGFKMRNRKDPLDWNHCKLAMEYFAHLHSMSFVLKKINPELLLKLSNLPETFFCRRFLEYYKNLRMENAVKRVISCLDEEKEKHCIEKIKYIRENFIELFEECVLSEENNGYCVISHGDCWTNNIFYKYKESDQKSPTAVCFIDWQLSRYVSPLIDITYFIYASSDKNFRSKYLKQTFEHYYSKLTENLQKFGENIDDHYPREEFEKHIQKYSKFGLLIAIVALHAFLSDEDELFTAEEIMKRREEYEEAILKKAKTDAYYRERLHDIIVEICEANLI